MDLVVSYGQFQHCSVAVGCQPYRTGRTIRQMNLHVQDISDRFRWWSGLVVLSIAESAADPRDERRAIALVEGYKSKLRRQG